MQRINRMRRLIDISTDDLVLDENLSREKVMKIIMKRCAGKVKKAVKEIIDREGMDVTDTLHVNYALELKNGSIPPKRD